MPKKVLVLGGNSAGSPPPSASSELQGDVDVTVISAPDRFLFNPLLIWLPFGKRRPQDITFPLARPSRPTRSTRPRHGDPHRPNGPAGANGPWQLPLRLKVIATGYRNRLEVIPGLEVANSAYTITTLEDAIPRRRRLVAVPGRPRPGGGWATQGVGCVGAAGRSAALASPVLAAWFTPSAGQPVRPDP